MGDRRWSIGQLARASGVTVRTLHYYDQIGLVSPGERTAAGHRRYLEADVRRLYRVRALCGLGLSLEEVSTVLHDDPDSLRDLLTAQLADLEIQADRIEQSANRIRALLASTAPPDPEQLLAALEPLQLDIRPYFSDTQLAALTERAGALGPDTIERRKREWIDLFTQLRQHLLDDTPVDDPAVQRIVVRWQQIAAEFGSDDTRFAAATDALWRDNRDRLGKQLDQRTGLADTAKVVDYLRRARAEA
ncbi:MAG TPA: MerR family transcriptional regulator [Pseudonocardiaceae bacterium]|jgi:DNA-binding transcriptional MerR regulator